MIRLGTTLAAFTLAAALAVAQPAHEAAPQPEAMLALEDGQHGYRGFDRHIIVDYVRAVTGNAEARQRVLNACEAALDEDPGNAEALAWRGATSMLEAGEASEAGNFMRAMQVVNTATGDLSRAREMAPDNPAVRLVIGQTLTNLAMNHPMDATARQYAKQAIEDVQAGLAPLHAAWGGQPAAVKGQALLDIARSYVKLGQSNTARDWYNRVIGAVPGTQWAERAHAWIEDADRRANAF